jgi:hypothetical protein
MEMQVVRDPNFKQAKKMEPAKEEKKQNMHRLTAAKLQQNQKNQKKKNQEIVKNFSIFGTYILTQNMELVICE